ncbi:MAG TPA: hypothetical protein VK654_06245 [Nitrospirota bacterium]|nr:hypothetical protein [Nitrospirota bacterium]
MLGFRKLVVMILSLALALPALAAAESTPLNRDEVTVIKRKLMAIADAVGQPAGYAKEDESYNLPTETSKMQNSGAFHALYASARFKFGGGSEKKAKKSQKEMEAEYKKKMMEAQAKGDYQEMSKIAQEMQQKSGKAQLEAENAKKEPVEANIQLNANSGQAIDPDAVVFEKPGVIALKFKTGDEDKIRIVVYFDPVHLKDTKTLSRVEMYDKQDKGVTNKTAVRNAAIEMTGPAAIVDAWAKAIATGKVLAQIDAK